MNALDAAIALIAKRGALRTDALAAELGIGENAVDAMLEPACADGRLTTCRVVTGGCSRIEYRCSASGGGYKFTITPTTRKPSTPPPAPPRRELGHPNAEPKGETMKLADRIRAAIQEHGPMTSRELRARGIADEQLSAYLTQMAAIAADDKKLIRLGGGLKSTIYGLPGQTLAERKVDGAVGAKKAAERSVASRKPRAKVKKKAGSKAAKKAWKTRRKNARKDKPAARSFRPALTADGAILFLGAKQGEFEIPRADTRALVDLVRKLTGPELAVAVGFIETLDRAEVAA